MVTCNRTTAHLATALLCLVTMAATEGRAAGLQVTPTGVTLGAHQNADGLWLSNTGNETLHAQLRTYRWSQVDGEDRLEPTRDLIVSPPALQLPSGERQLVRVIRAGPPPTEGESEGAYRVVVDELPVPAGEGAARPRGLKFVLQYSLPVFLLPKASAPALPGDAPMLRAEVVAVTGKPRLRVSNGGSRHAQLVDLAFVDATGTRHMVGEGLAGYVLAGQHRTWPLPATLEAGRVGAGSFRARLNGELPERTLQPGGVAGPTR